MYGSPVLFCGTVAWLVLVTVAILVIKGEIK
jgi:hypothetical protein